MGWTDEMRAAQSERMRCVHAKRSQEQKDVINSQISGSVRSYFDGMSVDEKAQLCKDRSDALTEGVRAKIAESVNMTYSCWSKADWERHRRGTSAGTLAAVVRRPFDVEVTRQLGISVGLERYHAGKSDEERAIFSDKMREAGKLGMAACRRSPNVPESLVLEYLNKCHLGEWKFTGNGDIWFGNRNPDFMNVNGKKEVVEVMGTYWHPSSDEQDRIDHYAKYGFKCTVLWDWECYVDSILEKRLG